MRRATASYPSSFEVCIYCEHTRVLIESPYDGGGFNGEATLLREWLPKHVDRVNSVVPLVFSCARFVRAASRHRRSAWNRLHLWIYVLFSLTVSYLP